ncbi:hypothetical protein ILUMI_05814 [Ignelater luminosus]|uniref:Uncharacterized protein n=1 Tax=Ignelater luminosus TaxID=2038154 RepID=A0A8K0GG07_IGNLU|nr:hypothetical protein ILUMI_05814 [Ignelater luminosus]
MKLVSEVTPSTKVVAVKEKKQVGQITSQERGERVIFMAIISAADAAVPPVFVYPRLRNPEKYLDDSHSDSAVAFGNTKDPPVQENPQLPQPSTSKAIVEPDRIERNTPCIIREKTPSSIPKSSEFQCPRLEDVRPFPKGTFEEKKRKNNRKSKSSIYTDIPEFIRQNTEAERERKKSVREKKTVQRSSSLKRGDLR